MSTLRRAALTLSAAVAALALSGCGSADTATTATSSPSAAMTSAATTTPAATTSPAPPPGEKVAAADLPAVVSDRTYRGDDEGKPYSEYYAPDGSLRGTSGGEAYTGSWAVTGEELCFSYPAAGAETETECYSVFKDGETITWVDAEGGVVATTSVEGNPDGL